MRLSHAFFQTLRDAPGDAELTSHQLLLRAGFIQPLGAGIYSFLPLARRSMDKIAAIIRAEMNAMGGQEVTLPVVHPADLWQQTGRWHTAYPELVHWKDRAGREMTLAMSHEEVVTDLARREISSYRQLPQMIYHLQTQFRDEPRPRGGLIGLRECTMMDAYTFDADEAGLDRQYRAHWQAYFNIFQRCGLDVRAVRADASASVGGSLAHEYMALSDAGEDVLLLCDACGYAANRQVARVPKPHPLAEMPLPLAKVATPDCKSIAELAAFLNLPASRTAKAVFLRDTGSGRVIFAVVRGDRDVNESKLAHVVGATGLQPASEEEIRAIGAQPGYGSPVGVHDCVVVVDDLAAASPNLVAGANEVGYHLLNVTCGRDYTPDKVADIVVARAGDACEVCGALLRTAHGSEVAHIFKLGTRYSEALGALYTDAEGNKRPIVMGAYGIGVERLLAMVAELSHDAAGLIWPVSIAPFQVHLVVLPKKAPDALRVADKVYMELTAAGIEVLYDDREDPSPGVKFNDADLIGLPLRVTVGAKALQEGGVELKRRDAADKQLVALAALLPTVQTELARLHAAIAARVQPVPFVE